MRGWVAGVLVLLVIATGVVAAEPRIVEVYPDPYADGDRGEYVAVEFTGSAGNYTLGDGEDRVHLPTSLNGTVFFVDGSLPPSVEANQSYPLGLSLANAGDTVYLNGSGVLDSVAWGDEGSHDVGEGDVIRPDDGRVVAPLGSTSLTYREFPASSVTAFVAPDTSGDVVAQAFRRANESIYVNAFSFDSGYLAEALRDAERRGVEVELLVEGSPPGGFERDDAEILDELKTAGAEIGVVDGEARRYRFLHAKYAVIDNRTAVVTSENWGRDSMSPIANGSRGWGAVIESQGVAGRLSAAFRSDADWRSVTPWGKADLELHEDQGDSTGVHTGFRPRDFGGARVGVVLAPDDALDPVVSMVESANRSILVQQAYIDSWEDGPNPYLDAVLNRARSGVEVRVLLDGRWYNREENQAVVDRLNRVAESEDLDLEARLSETPIHNKGIVVDGREVLVSSINWNENSVTRNREVGVLIRHSGAADYFTRVFQSDWSDEHRQPWLSNELLLEALLTIVVAAIGAWLALRSVKRKRGL